MNDKFVIGWYGTEPAGDMVVLYFVGKTFESDDWDTYGTDPLPVVHRSALLGEAKVFDTFDAAKTAYSEKDVWTTRAFVLTVSEKEIFHAKLKE